MCGKYTHASCLRTYVATDHMDKLAKDSTRDVLYSLLDSLEVCLYILYDMLRTCNSLNLLLEILLFIMYGMFNSWRFADYLLKVMYVSQYEHYVNTRRFDTDGCKFAE